MRGNEFLDKMELILPMLKRQTLRRKRKKVFGLNGEPLLPVLR